MRLPIARGIATAWFFVRSIPVAAQSRDNSGQVVCGNGKIDLVPELEKIRCPVLVVVPGADPILRWTNTG